jgi:2-dehydro-3-deoxyphosphogluconate aldolase / (4S)-4-hydroxy-2-oxoglutarate aldolase
MPFTDSIVHQCPTTSQSSKPSQSTPRTKNMPTSVSDLERLLTTGIVAVVRAADGARLVEVAEALAAGGVEAVEIAFTVPRAHVVLEQVADRLGDRVLLGAGTVLDTETARLAMLAGARFLVSPTLNHDVIRLARRYGRLIIPGAFTPSEVLSAWESGADLVKVFPSEVLGPEYVWALRGPLPQVRLMPTGGVTLGTAADFLRAGAAALGVGSALVSPWSIANGDLASIERLARSFRQLVDKTRAELAS